MYGSEKVNCTRGNELIAIPFIFSLDILIAKSHFAMFYTCVKIVMSH